MKLTNIHNSFAILGGKLDVEFDSVGNNEIELIESYSMNYTV